MTIDECMAKATAAIDELIADVLRNDAEILNRYGATQAELEAEMRIQVKVLQEWRPVQLAQLRGWLEREGETLQ
jgi:hypothetical protein